LIHNDNWITFLAKVRKLFHRHFSIFREMFRFNLEAIMNLKKEYNWVDRTAEVQKELEILDVERDTLGVLCKQMASH
jgi:hypothetical protein